MKKVWIAEIRRGWLSHHILGTFDTIEAAEKAIRVAKKSKDYFLGPDDFYEINWAYG